MKLNIKNILKISRNIFLLVILCYIAIFITPYYKWMWFDNFINNRPFPGLGFIDLISILSWVPTIIIFTMFGFFIYLLVDSKHQLYWSLSLGICSSLYKLFFTFVRFSEHTEIISYVYYYLEYFIIPMAALLGGWFASLKRKLTSRKPNTQSP
jgi:hypothetical protein